MRILRNIKSLEEAMLCFAKHYFTKHDIKKSLLYYKTISENNSEATYNIGGIYDLYLGKPEIAIKYYEMSIEKNNVNAMYNLANYYYEQEKYLLAEKYYLTILAQTPDPEIYFHLGCVYEQLNNYAQAEKYYILNNMDNILFKFYLKNKNIRAFILEKNNMFCSKYDKHTRQNFYNTFPLVKNLKFAQTIDSPCVDCSNNTTTYKYYDGKYYCDICYVSKNIV